MTKKQKIIENSSKLLLKIKKISLNNLKKIVEKYKNKYFITNNPEITNETYDKIIEIIKFKDKKENTNSLSRENLNIKISDKIIHEEPMLSLYKCYDNDSYYKWEKKINENIIATPKVDGVACSIHYINGTFKLAATRGSGRTGENITRHIINMHGVPLNLSKKINIEIRGEIYIKKSIFYNKFSDKFANPRNLTAGTLKQKNQDISKNYNLSFIPYDIKKITFNFEEEKFNFLKMEKFEIPDFKSAKKNNIEKIFKYYWKMRDKYEYEIDGIVLKASSVTDQINLGETEYYPRFSIAYKYQGKINHTKLIKIFWSIGKSGVITPICIFNSIFISGSTINKASLHNINIFKKLKFKENSLIKVSKRGGIIPHIEEVYYGSGKEINIINNCPSCKKTLIINKNYLFCSDPYRCKEVIKKRIIYFCKTIEIRGLGEKLINNLVNDGAIKELSDIYKLKSHNLLSLNNVGKALSRKILKIINEKRNIELYVFITSLGLKSIGLKNAKILSNHFKSLSKIRKINASEASDIHGIGEKTAKLFIKEFNKYKLEINELSIEIKIAHTENKNNIQNKDSIFFNKNIVFTGKISNLPRSIAKIKIKELGGKVTSSINKKTNYLIKSANKSKLDNKTKKENDANKFKIKIISEDELFKIINKI